jgi:hypothetical protein
MEKNKLRLALALFLLFFSFFCVFAQDGANANEAGDKEAVTASEEAVYDKSDPIISGELQAVPEITASAPVEKKNTKATDMPAKYSFLNYVISGFLFLAVAALVVLSHLFLRKLIYEEKENLKKEMEQTIRNIMQKYDEKYDDTINKHQYSSNTNDKLGILEERISRIQSEISILGELRNNVDTLYFGKKITRSIKSGNLDVADAFNLWAANPNGPLPEAFYYIEGEMNIRTKREIKESAGETKWITNRNGIKKYLFPNPNSFNQMTNILELYKMDQAKLKGRGQNKIKIITPCEMTKEGFVEFAGELELL